MSKYNDDKKENDNKKGHANLFMMYVDDYTKKGKRGKKEHTILSQKNNIEISKTTEVTPIGTRYVITVKTMDNKFKISQKVIRSEIKLLTKQIQKKSDDYKINTRVSLPQRWYTFKVDGDSGDIEGYENVNPSLI